MKIYSDGIGNPYVYEVTEDEQVDVLYSGSSIEDCEAWINGYCLECKGEWFHKDGCSHELDFWA